MAATPSRRIALGQWGEQKAAEHLAEQGMEIVDRNWRCTLGELDIVAYDGSTLVMVEVKTRTSEAFGSPFDAVTPRKAARLRQLASLWLRDHGDRPLEVRIDVVGVLVPPRGQWCLDHRKAVA